MKKIEAIVKPSDLRDIKSALGDLGITGMTVSEVLGFSREEGHTELFRGRETTQDLLPQIKIEVVLPGARAKDALEAILKSAGIGNSGRGKVFIAPIEQAIRIRTEERGEKAI